jgi:hypothetical protein
MMWQNGFSLKSRMITLGLLKKKQTNNDSLFKQLTK